MKNKVLAYPKMDFTKKQVLREIGHFRYPKAWKYHSDKLNHYLVLHVNLVKKYYFDKGNPNGRVPPLEKGNFFDNIKIPRIL